MTQVIIDEQLVRRLTGKRFPSDVFLASTQPAGDVVSLSTLTRGPTIVIIYPMGTRPGAPLPTDWMSIPGAKGCTGQNKCFAKNHEQALPHGFSFVGLSVQSSEDQAEFARQNEISYPLLSDPDLRLADALGLPTFEVDGRRFYQRAVLLVASQKIRGVIYPIDEPVKAAEEAMFRMSDLAGSGPWRSAGSTYGGKG